MKYKKGETITIKTHEEMIAEADIKCWFSGNQNKPSGTRTYSCQHEKGSLVLMNALAKKVLGKKHKILAVKPMGYDLELIAFVRDWMIQDDV